MVLPAAGGPGEEIVEGEGPGVAAVDRLAEPFDQVVVLWATVVVVVFRDGEVEVVALDAPGEAGVAALPVQVSSARTNVWSTVALWALWRVVA